VKEEPLTSDDVRRVMERHPSLTFKLVVESCFSGRWTILAAQPNLRIILTSARANEVTFLAVTDPRAGFQKDGVLELSGSDLTTADGPDDPPPFTAGLDKALDEWAGDAGERAKGEELGKALGYAGAHRDGDKARTLGWQHGNTVDRTDERPHAPLPSTVVTFGVSVAGSYRHIGPGQSEACFVVQTSPARPDAEVHVSASGPGVVSQPAVAHTDASGSVRVRVPIDAYGTYQATATVTAGDGGQASGSGSVTVTSAAGTCPAP
jgi:hypothetical protein